MNITIINESGFKELKIVCNGKEYYLKNNSNISIENLPNTSEIEFIPLDKNLASMLSWLFFGILDVVIDLCPFDSGLFARLYSSDICTISSRCENCKIYLKELSVENEKWDDITYIAPYIFSDDVDINSVRYEPKKCTKEKLKFYFIHFIIWLIIFLIAASISFDDSEFYRNVMGFLGAVFAIFTVFRIRKSRLCFSEKKISEVLLDKDLEYRLNGNKEKPYEPKNFVERRIFSFADKVMSRIFRDKN